MKKIITILSIALTIVLLCTTAAFAVGRNANKIGNDADNNGICDNRQNADCTVNYTDADNNGICDNKQNADCTVNYTDADNNGICDNRQNANCTVNYTDADNNGICDNRENADCGNTHAHTHRSAHGKHHRNHK